MQILNELKNITDEKNIFVDEPMSKHTTFKTGGVADYFVMPESREEIEKIISLDVPKTIIGNGSNILVKDGGIRGIVICLTNLNNYKVEDDEIYAEAGIFLSKLSKVALQNNLSGLEFACGIPGTLGGAVMMNAGAYGSEMKNVIISSEYIDSSGKIHNVEDHKFGYRKSIFKDLNGAVILSGRLKLNFGDKELIKNKMDENMSARNSKQPINFPSAGSTFKRPEGFFAAKLIEDAGLKGYSIGGAEVSTLHAGFVINKGNATSKDIIDLILYIQKTVQEKFNVMLEPEVRIIGED